MLRLFLIVSLCLLNSACYYMQAASGQWEVMRKREPIGEVVADPATSPELVARLRLLSDARKFSIDELGLPDNGSYTTYADLERDYVVWNVIATPEFSLAPQQWCFPVAGCVAYRGYFSSDKANKAAQKLADKGFDVAVGGVAAYSTLGKFDDPILSTMMHWQDPDLVALLFHELAHQVVYVKDDSAFNESFATTVEQIGLQRWLQAKADIGAYEQYLDRRRYRREISALVEATREELASLYDSRIDVQEMRRRKKLRLEKLSTEIHAIAAQANVRLSGWMSGELNNAHLVSTALYEGLVPQFRALYRDCGDRLECFYDAAKRLGKLDKDARDRLLAAGDLRRLTRGTDDE